MHAGRESGADYQEKPSSGHEIFDANLQKVCLCSRFARRRKVSDQIQLIHLNLVPTLFYYLKARHRMIS